MYVLTLPSFLSDKRWRRHGIEKASKLFEALLTLDDDVNDRVHLILSQFECSLLPTGFKMRSCLDQCLQQQQLRQQQYVENAAAAIRLYEDAVQAYATLLHKLVNLPSVHEYLQRQTMRPVVSWYIDCMKQDQVSRASPPQSPSPKAGVGGIPLTIEVTGAGAVEVNGTYTLQSAW